jgi:hypothetical protein
MVCASTVKFIDNLIPFSTIALSWKVEDILLKILWLAFSPEARASLKYFYISPNNN